MQFTREQLDAEIEEKTRDLDAFTEARKVIRDRVSEVADSRSELTPLARWSGTDAVLGSLDLAIHAMERTLSQLIAMEDAINGEGPNLKIVSRNDDEQER